MKTRKIKTFVFTILFLFLVFQQAILIYLPQVGLLSYVDEALTCVFLVVIVVRLLRHPVRLMKTELLLVSMILLFLAFGIVSTIANPIQEPALSAADAMVCCKFVVFYLAGRVLLDSDDTRMLVHAASVCARAAAITLTLLALHEILFTKWFHSFDVRFGFDTLQLFFPHPTYLAFAAFTLAAVLMLRMSIPELQCRRDMVYILLLFFVTFMTGRSKAMATLACSVLILVFYVVLKNRSRLFIALSGGILAFAVGWNSLFDYYLMNDQSGSYRIRMMMHEDGAMLARNFFPLATGFGTFGSAVAAGSYSQIYYDLGYDQIWGMQPTRSDYLCDTFWPIVLAQTGWIGTVCFGIAVACFLLIAFRAVGKNRWIAWMLISVIIYELISSIAETSFFSFMFKELCR